MTRAARTIYRWTAIALALVLLSWPLGGRAEDALTPAQVRAVEALIESYILAHPDIIERASARLEEEKRLAAAQTTREIIAAHRDALLNDPHAFVMGNPSGDVTIVEFFDYRCSYCKRAYPTVAAFIAEDPGVRVVLREFPILGPESTLASQYAIATLRAAPDKYLALHGALMESRGALDKAALDQIVAEVGIDAAAIAAEASSAGVAEVIATSYRLADMLGVSGTPAFVIGEQLVPGAVGIERLRTIVAEARSGCTTC